jgi:UDPglucose--hexose-1-phosphate uridylyltransferase
MPEFRQNLATKDWVIVEAVKKPADFKVQGGAPAQAPADCPFCPGHESLTGPALFALGKPDWKVRVVSSNRPALISGAPAVGAGGLYRHLPGEGIHEVIVESPAHDKHPALLDKKAMVDLVSVYRSRFIESLSNDRISLTTIFKNHVRGAGDHSHSQLVGSSVVPQHIRHRMDEAQKYFEQNSACAICRMVDEEERAGARMIASSANFRAFVLFAALSPFHVWIVPKRHTPSFGDMTDKETEDLAGVLQTVLRKFDAGLNNPDYNYVIQSTPLDRGTTDAFHWYISLMARLAPASGFELGSGMHVNQVLPEDSAQFLNSVKA